MLKARQKFGKYVIERKLGEGGFAIVYQARDTIEGIRVALKVPYSSLLTGETIEMFRHEARLAAKLEHPHILPLKHADFVEGKFVIVTALGDMTLDDRLQKRMSVSTGIDLARQMLQAVAYAHTQRIVHCDIKPDNFLLFPGNRIRLTDFGIARVAQKTLRGSGTGTVGYVAPEQAMGKPSLRSDVFSLGIVMYRMFSGQLPEWPYKWPPPGYSRLRSRLRPDFIALIQKAINLDAGKRYRDAQQMLAAFDRVKSPGIKRDRMKSLVAKKETTKPSWQTIRVRQFLRQHGKGLGAHFHCESCEGPVSEFMSCCPWCGKSRRVHQDGTQFPIQCPRCHRGLKADWRYCPWCYGEGFQPRTHRKYSDQRYLARCDNPRCDRKWLMPFMRYCPWCRRRVRRKWKIEGNNDKCGRCGWGVLGLFWSHCPWCSKRIEK
jgi:serine/threonine-protein kinase